MSDTKTDAPAPEHGRLHFDEGPQDVDIAEVASWSLVKRGSSEDVFLWATNYFIAGNGANEVLVKDARMVGTVFFAVPNSPGGGMEDNNFVRRGLQPMEYLSPRDVVLQESAEEVSWTIGGRTVRWRQGDWRLEGKHAGVELDVTCRPVGPGVWTPGPFENVARGQSAGFNWQLTAEGTARVEGKTFDLSGAVGVHQRDCMVHQPGRDVMWELGGTREALIGDVYADGVHATFVQHANLPMKMGLLKVDGTNMIFAGGEGISTEITVLERWHDPRNAHSVPSKLLVTMVSPEGTLELECFGRGRAYWHNVTRSGVMMLMWILGRANGTLRRSDGSTREIVDASYALRFGKTILATEETLSGQEFAGRLT